MNTGDRIKQRRIGLGLSVDDLAKRLNKNRATIYRYENSEIKNLPVAVLEPLAQILQTTPAHLMGWEENIPDLIIDDMLIEFETSPKDVRLKQMIAYFNNLSEIGKRKALDNIEDLSKIYSLKKTNLSK